MSAIDDPGGSSDGGRAASRRALIHSCLDRGQFERVLSLVRDSAPEDYAPGELHELTGWAQSGLALDGAARKSFLHSLQEAPTNGPALIGLAQSERRLRNLAASERAALRCLELYPAWSRPYVEYVRTLVAGYQFEKARAVLTEAERLAPRDTNVAEAAVCLAWIEGNRSA
jgi:Flp pilus assembly protein TadD